ncbi:MAG: PH domain-containing protein [Methanomassiliicoccaceae archaeon]|nr:PH domain-containing protein [Methanomassiliicoccaceae archaeon]
MERIYKPNIGPLFWVHLLLILVVAPILAVLTFMDITPAGLLIPIVLILLLLVVIALLVVARTMYTMDDEKITIQGAFKKREIPYESVTKIVNTDKGIAGEGMLVLSADRIGIFFGEDGKATMSPRDKSEALDALRSYCPDAEYEEIFKPKKAEEGTTESGTEDQGTGSDEASAEDLSEDPETDLGEVVTEDFSENEN